ncbi:hypothetical protein ABW20_dc0104275 [Dactylellina cionopaga]|nr:hypothetical protein ABW20_dc0104275 [Dactylellina cionopaga]
MVAISKTAVVFASVLGLIGGATAAPLEEIDYTKTLVPGPGLPSVAELGLTNADLTKPIPEGRVPLPGITARDGDIFKRWPRLCWPLQKCTYGDAVACYNYLDSIGSRQCSSDGTVTMCYSGGCKWVGRSESGTASSPCSDVALAGRWLISECRDNNGEFAGTIGAYGNGALGLVIAHT